MIRKASELLEKFIEVETRKLKDFPMPHMPTLGSAYEEITKQGLYQDFAIPKGLDLRVVSGFISVGGVSLPEQIDCMLVHGEGARYGLTQQFEYDIEQVLCIFEVKKTLRKSDYVDAIQHLAKIRRKFADNFEVRLRSGNYKPDISAARRNFSMITGRVAPEEYLGIHDLSKGDGILFYTLVQESLAPTTIVHGYGGYKKESGLRKVFLDIVDDAKGGGSQSLGVPSIPTLVTSNEFCIVKGNGTPFLVMQNKNEWVSVFSTRHNSAKIILELVWSKISSFFNIEMPWADGLHMDSARSLLIAKGGEHEGVYGWKYNAIDCQDKYLVREDNAFWAPSELSRAEVSALNIMVARGGYLPLDEEMNDYLVEAHGVTVDQVAEALILTREFMRDGDCVRPIHTSTYIVTNEDETGYVASLEGRFDLWCEENDVEPDYMCLYFME